MYPRAALQNDWMNDELTGYTSSCCGGFITDCNINNTTLFSVYITPICFITETGYNDEFITYSNYINFSRRSMST